MLLRQYTIDDAEFILKLVNTPGWLEHIGDRNVHDTEAAKNYLINGDLKSYERLGYGFFAVILKSNGALIGSAGLTKRDFLEAPDIGYAFLPEYWGQGLAIEAAKAILSYAQNQLDISRIIAVTTKANIRSRRLLKKLGMHYEKDMLWPKSDDTCMIYST